MERNWTEDQKKAIELRDCSILVSAAAGSGKTAVLVERILRKVMDPQRPVNIDSMVMMTFTKAAAGEMRERIMAALEKAAALEPDNAHLQKQKTLIHNANITTIDSFCTMILRNHFEEINLDPAFRVADENETMLLKKEAIDKVLEARYEAAAQKESGDAFTEFVEAYAGGRSDENLEELILTLYDFSMSHPFPKRWLDESLEKYEIADGALFEEQDWVRQLVEEIRFRGEHSLSYARRALELCEEESPLAKYGPAMKEYVDVSQRLSQITSYAQGFEILQEFQPGRLPAVRCGEEWIPMRELAKRNRDECSGTIKELREKFYFDHPTQIVEKLSSMKEKVTVLVELTKEFMEAYGELKRDRDVLDFSDLEHLALKVLVGEDGEPTQVAREYGDRFDEIMVDEYQDSNYVQELLISAISKRPAGGENVFMVGDAKQSIYRFRMARPELFTEKFDAYSTTEGNRRRIDLSRNFRSRESVLNGVNYVFWSLMKRQVGGIDYDSAAALYAGGSFVENPSGNNVELLLYDKSVLRQQEAFAAAEFEARMIGTKIQELVKGEQPFLTSDSEGGLRRCRYGDVAILVRGGGTLADTIEKVFGEMGIPLYSPSRTGYFDTEEIGTMLNLLAVIDNPLQDIPLAAVLKSPICGMGDEELARIGAWKEEVSFHEKARAYARDGEDQTAEKLRRFFGQLEAFRRKSETVSLHEMVWYVLEETGYGDYVSATEKGRQAKTNLEAFLQKTMDFEKNGETGIFRFLRYIEQMRSFRVEEGEASVVNEQDDTVRLMTIHKSKGLEFPIVFVVGLSTPFNRRDESSPLIMHPDLGFGMDFVDVVRREKKVTLLKRFLSDRIHRETVGESLRILYVAMTRAKEKLFLSGGVNKLENSLSQAAFENTEQGVEGMAVVHAGSFLDLLLAALAPHPDMRGLFQEVGLERPERSANPWNCRFDVHLLDTGYLVERRAREALETGAELTRFEERKSCISVSREFAEKMDFVYPFASDGMLPVKVSVSEIKRIGAQDEEALELIPKERQAQWQQDPQETAGEGTEEEPELLPAFMRKQETDVPATARGTAYHTVFEHLDFERAESDEELVRQLDELVARGVLEPEVRSLLRPDRFRSFVRSDLGKRMARAQRAGLLWREQPFVLSVDPEEIYQEELDVSENKKILVQGIIDAFFEEDGELVIVDYKTDYARAGMEEVLAGRYARQMEFYEKALTKLLEKNVKERIIYSVSLNREIRLC